MSPEPSILHPWFPDLDVWCKEHFLTRPGYVSNTGRPLDPGISMLVASSLDDRTDAYYENTTLAMRRMIRVDIAQAPTNAPVRALA